MTNDEYTVFIVDDDNRIREALCELLASHGIQAIAFGSAGDYVNSEKPDAPACLLLDIELPDINGLDLQSEIATGEHPPIVFITGHGDIRSSVRAIKDGAVDFLTKPFTDADLMAAIHAAIAEDEKRRAERAEFGKLRRRYLDLTPREREVLPLVISGLLNKQAAAELGISEVTLQIHRRNVMQKMKAGSFADLVRIAERLKIPITHARKTGVKSMALPHRQVVAIVDAAPPECLQGGRDGQGGKASKQLSDARKRAGEGGEGEGGKPRNQPGDQPGEADTPSQDQESKLREKNAGGGREASTRRRFDEQVNDDPQGYVEKPW